MKIATEHLEAQIRAIVKEEVASEATELLTLFALWNSPIWDPENEDDVAAARARAEEFLNQ